MVRSSNPIPLRRGDGDGDGVGHRPRSHRLLVTALLISASLFLVGASAGATLTVGPGERIQAAIDCAGDGDVVLVEAGVYRERLVVDKGIALQGVASPSITAGGSGSAVTLLAEGASIVGFEIFGSGSEETDAGVRVLAKGCTVEENLVVENGIGILLQAAGGATISNNSVEKNGVGIFLMASWENDISYNRISENGEGIRIAKSDASESITASDGGGVSIKYRPKSEAPVLSVSEIGFAAGRKENRIFGNELLNNGKNSQDDGENLWHLGNIGNHHSDFDSIEEGCRDRDRDEICDSPLKIPGGHSVDGYPVATEDAVLRYRAVSGDFELFLYRSTFSPGQKIPLGFKAPGSFSGQAVLVLHAPGPGEGEDGTGAAAGPAEAAVSNQPLEGEKGTVAFTAPEEEGSYAFLMLDGSGIEIVALPFKVATPALEASTSSAGTCDGVIVNFSGAPGFEEDWIGLFAAGSGDDSPISREHLDGDSDGSLSFAMPPSAGIYDFRLFEDGGQKSLAKSGAVEVKPSAGVRIRASPAAARPGEPITVSFWGAKPASAIGMYEMTSPDKFMLAMQWTSGRSCGTMTFRAPSAPGRYDFRLFEDNVHRKHMGASNVVVVG